MALVIGAGIGEMRDAVTVPGVNLPAVAVVASPPNHVRARDLEMIFIDAVIGKLCDGPSGVSSGDVT